VSVESLPDIIARLTAKRRHLAALVLRKTREDIHHDATVNRLLFVVSKLSDLSTLSR